MVTLDSLVRQCGGLRKFARECRKTPGALQHWLSRGRIPGWHLPAVADAAARLGHPLSAEEQLQLVQGSPVEPVAVQAARDAGA